MEKKLFMLVVFTLAFNSLLGYSTVLAKDLDPAGDTPILNLPICDQAGYCMNETTYSWDDPIDGDDWNQLTDLIEPEISTPAMDLGFSFPYYGNTYSKIYIGKNGFVTFGEAATSQATGTIPDLAEPNAYIAPSWSSYYSVVGLEDKRYVYYKQDLTASPKQFKVVWYKISPIYNQEYFDTFSLVIDEIGNISFFYQEAKATVPYPTIGIEDPYGELGIQYLASNHQHSIGAEMALSFTPPTTNITTTYPVHFDTLVYANKPIDIPVVLRNRTLTQAEVGLSLNGGLANWSTEILDSTATNPISTPLSIEASGTANIVLRITPSATAVEGDMGKYTLSVLSGEKEAKAEFKLTIPAAFVDVVSYTIADQENTREINFTFPNADFTREGVQNITSYNSENSAIEALPNGNFAYLWEDFVQEAEDNNHIFLQILDPVGNELTEPFQVSAQDPEADPTIYQNHKILKVEVAHNGNVAIIWKRNKNCSENFYLSVFDQAGIPLQTPIAITNYDFPCDGNEASSGWYAGLQFGSGDSLIALVPVEEIDRSTGSFIQTTIYEVVTDISGWSANPVKVFSTLDPSTSNVNVQLTALRDGNFLFTYDTSYFPGEETFRYLLDPNGQIVDEVQYSGIPENNVSFGSDSLILDNGTIVSAGNYGIQFASYDPETVTYSELSTISNSSLHHPIGGQYIGWASLAKTPTQNIIFFWTTTSNAMLYSLLNSDGDFLTSPIIFKPAMMGSSHLSQVSGSGISSLIWQPSYGVDLSTNFGEILQVDNSPNQMANGIMKSSRSLPVTGIQLFDAPARTYKVPINYYNLGLASSAESTLTFEFPENWQIVNQTVGSTFNQEPGKIEWEFGTLSFADSNHAEVVLSLGNTELSCATFKLLLNLITEDDTNTSNNVDELILQPFSCCYLPMVTK